MELTNEQRKSHIFQTLALLMARQPAGYQADIADILRRAEEAVKAAPIQCARVWSILEPQDEINLLDELDAILPKFTFTDVALESLAPAFHQLIKLAKAQSWDFEVQGLMIATAAYMLSGSISSMYAGWLTNELRKLLVVKEISALEYAVQQHGDQMYGDAPYEKHLVSVATLAARQYHTVTGRNPIAYAGFTIEQVADVAALHDVLEDTAATYDDLRMRFGATVAVAVLALTKPKHDYDYSTYIAQVRANPLALLVKQADTLCNLAASVADGAAGAKRVAKYSKQIALLCAE